MSQKPRNHNVGTVLRANATEHVIEKMRRLPRLCIKVQDKKVLSSMVRLNHIITRAEEALEKAA